MARAANKSEETNDMATDNNTAELQQQIEQLKQDIASIAATLTNLGQEKLRGAKENASKAYENLHEQGEEIFDNVSGCASHFEEQLSTAIKERPISAVAIAAGIGYLIALLRR